MKRILLLVALSVLLVVSLSSCGGTPFPHGRWENSELGLILEADRQDANPFLGTSVVDGEKIDIMISYESVHSIFWMFRSPGLPEVNFETITGNFRRRGRQLHLYLDQQSRELTGFDTIVLDRILDNE